jgi:hypothetical protein
VSLTVTELGVYITITTKFHAEDNIFVLGKNHIRDVINTGSRAYINVAKKENFTFC